MNHYFKPIVLTGFVSLISVGIGVALAQAPSMSLPPLPGMPAVPAPSAPSAAPTPTASASAPSTPTVPQAPQASNTFNSSNTSNSPDVKVSGVTEVPAAPAKTDSSALPPLPNESADKAPAATKPTSVDPLAAITPSSATPNLNELPPLPMPNANKSAMEAPSVPMPQVAALPSTADDKPKEKAPETKTWMTKLAPAIIPPKLGYQYRRELLSSEVYRTRYDPANRHLPVAMTKDDYARLFLMSVARNDVSGTRALLHAGVPVGTTNARGETALALAERYHAGDTTKLLMAYGAQ